MSFVNFGESMRGKVPGIQIQYLNLYISGQGDKPELGRGLRFRNLREDWYNIEIHEEDVDEFAERVLFYRRLASLCYQVGVELQKIVENLSDRSGRGAALSIADFLQKGLLREARATAFSEGDKIAGNPLLRDLIESCLFALREPSPWNYLNRLKNLVIED